MSKQRLAKQQARKQWQKTLRGDRLVRRNLRRLGMWKLKLITHPAPAGEKWTWPASLGPPCIYCGLDNETNHVEPDAWIYNNKFVSTEKLCYGGLSVYSPQQPRRVHE